MDWIQQRHTPTLSVLHRILLKWILTNNSGTDWIQPATSWDIIQLNPVTKTNSGTILAFVLECKFWLCILPSTFSLALHSGVAIHGLKWRMGEGGGLAYGWRWWHPDEGSMEIVESPRLTEPDH
jgi:hypothetical protein